MPAECRLPVERTFFVSNNWGGCIGGGVALAVLWGWSMAYIWPISLENQPEGTATPPIPPTLIPAMNDQFRHRYWLRPSGVTSNVASDLLSNTTTWSYCNGWGRLVVKRWPIQIRLCPKDLCIFHLEDIHSVKHISNGNICIKMLQPIFFQTTFLDERDWNGGNEKDWGLYFLL